MEKNTIIAIALAGLVLISLVQAFEIANVKSKMTGYSGSAVKENNGGSGEQTYEEMMAEMHPGQSSPSVGQSSPSAGSSPTMVGGC